MAIDAQTLIDLIKSGFPGAEVVLEDLRGDGDHYAVTVISESFRGLSRIKQHQMVYAALQGKMTNELHALSIATRAP